MITIPMLCVFVWAYYKGKDLDKAQQRRREEFDWEKASKIYHQLGGK